MLKPEIIWIIGLLLLLTGCDREFFGEEPKTYSLGVTIKYPAYYTEDMAAGVSVKLINQSNSLTEEAFSNDQGQVLFTDVLRGTYRISANLKIPSSLAVALGDTIPSSQDIADGKLINLNANRQDIFISDFINVEPLILRSSIPGTLLIKEVFYTGTTTPNGRAYWSDHFVEIFNNTDKVIFADKLYIANCFGSNGSTDGQVSEFQHLSDSVALEFVWRVPGNGGSWPILPGASMIIAQDGMNHRDDPNGNPNSIDLTSAELETYIYRPENQKDVDILEVPNMIEVFFNRNGTHDWILHSYGPSLVIFRTDNIENANIVPEPSDELGHEVMLIPSSWVLDGFEALAYPRSGKYKRLPVSLDAGFQYCTGIFNGQSCRRKVEDKIDGRVILQDFNNSSEDFEIIPFPTPGIFE